MGALKVLYENSEYDILLDILDSNPNTCTLSVSCSRMDVVSVAQDTIDPKKFTISIGELSRQNLLVKFTYFVINGEGRSNSTYEYVLLKNSIVNDVRYYIKADAENLFVDIDDYDDIDILNKIKNVNMIGSGLDSDFLSGFSVMPNSATNAIPLTDPVGKIGVDWVPYPININFVTWNDDDHFADTSYILMINATDPQDQDITYEVLCSDPNVIVTQTNTPYIWNVTYPSYSFNMNIVYYVIASNESGLISSSLDFKNISINTSRPVIESITWDDDLHEEEGSYTVTISAYDPQGQDIAYTMTCDDPNTIITGDSVPYVYHIIYPTYDANTTVSYTVTTTNEDLVEAVKIYPVIVINTTVLTVDRAIFTGGNTVAQEISSIMDYISMSVLGNAAYFGGITMRHLHAGCSNGINDRGVFAGGRNENNVETDSMKYLTISSLGNTLTFNDLTTAKSGLAGCSNGVDERGIFAGGGLYGSVTYTAIEYITINTLSHGALYGNLTISNINLTSCANSTLGRGLFAGGTNYSTVYDNIEWITISNYSNASIFGNLAFPMDRQCSCSNGVNDRGIFIGGTNQDVYYNIMEYVTISSAGNATNFAQMVRMTFRSAGTSNGPDERGVYGGGRTSKDSSADIIDDIAYITINSQSSATDFGNLSLARAGIGAVGDA